MTRYIALLRSINVGTGRTIKMDALRTMFAAARATDVATYIQSGNVVFTHARGEASLVEHLEKHIAEAAGFPVPVILRTAADWTRVVANNPFPADHAHVFFLPAAAPKLDIVAVKPERFEVRGREVYVDLPNGFGRSKLAGSLGKALSGATARNWRTVQQLHAMVSSRVG